MVLSLQTSYTRARKDLPLSPQPQAGETTKEFSTLANVKARQYNIEAKGTNGIKNKTEGQHFPSIKEVLPHFRLLECFPTLFMHEDEDIASIAIFIVGNNKLLELFNLTLGNDQKPTTFGN